MAGALVYQSSEGEYLVFQSKTLPIHVVESMMRSSSDEVIASYSGSEFFVEKIVNGWSRQIKSFREDPLPSDGAVPARLMERDLLSGLARMYTTSTSRKTD